MKKSIIITGGSGQDGIILSKLLLSKNYSIHSFVNKKKLNKIPLVKYYYINLLNYNLLTKIVKEIKPFAIIHLASKNLAIINNENMKHKIFYKNNFLITKNLVKSIIENDKKIKFMSAGSSQMFKKTNGIVNENAKFKSTCYYSKYKIDAHNYIILMKKRFKLLATTMILFNHDSKYRNSKFLFPRLANYLKHKRIKRLKEIYQKNIFGDFSHADDICNGIFLLIKSNQNLNKIIFSSNKLLRLNDLIDFGLMKLKMNYDMPFVKVKIIKLIGNNNLAKKLLNWQPTKNSLSAFKDILRK